VEVRVILFVCEGNVCRSALAACLLGAALAPRYPELQVDSAGTLATAGQPMDPATAAIVRRNGVDPSAHRARSVSLALVGQAGLILTATRRVRSAVVQMHPPAVQRTFTIRQVGRILDTAPDSLSAISTDADGLIEELRLFIVRHRGTPPGDPTVDDVVDPRGQRSAVHEWAAQQMRPALGQVALALGVEPAWPDWLHDHSQPKSSVSP
jgi:protein-tyrosine phosphatase